MLREFYDCQSIANPMTKEFTPLAPLRRAAYDLQVFGQ
jgi:hypothetical protein